jgi:hypothetical protein
LTEGDQFEISVVMDDNIAILGAINSDANAAEVFGKLCHLSPRDQ